MDAAELWRAVPGFEGRYSVSSHGRVRREPLGTIMRAKGARLIYPRVNLYRAGTVSCMYVHRLVAEVFLGPCPPGKETNHVDGDQSHNHVANLEYVTHAENTQHAHDIGLVEPATAGANARTKLSEADVRRLRQHALAPRAEVIRLAAEVGITERHALHIMYGERWRHLPYLPSEPVRAKR